MSTFIFALFVFEMWERDYLRVMATGLVSPLRVATMT